MKTKSQRSRGRDGALALLNAAVNDLASLRDASSVQLTKDAFASVGVLLATVQESMVDQVDCVKLGLACANICKSINQGLDGTQVDQPSRSVLDAIERFTMIVADIQKRFVKWGKRSAIIPKLLRAKSDKEAIAAWGVVLGEIRRVFDAELVARTDANSPDPHHDNSTTDGALPVFQCDASITGVVASSAHNGVSNTYAAASSVHHDLYARPIALEIENEPVGARNTSSDHPNTLKDHKNTGGQNWASVPEDRRSPSPRIASEADLDIRRDVAKIGDTLSDLQRHVADLSEGLSKINQDRAAKNSVPGESPPPPKRIFGRDDLIEEIVGFAGRLMPIALVGGGGIGKTSIALKVLHDDRVKQRFGDDRRFIRCDKFDPSLAHFLCRLSKAIGTGIENPEDLSSLRQFLSSKEMMIILDNADSILDPEGQNAREIYSAIEELSQFSNIFLCITSRISIVPPDCEIFEIPTLSMEAARDAFHDIYTSRLKKQSDLVDDILEQLEFHPPSIALLATVGYQNRWSIEHLVEEWKQHGSALLETKHMTSPTKTIELSLASPSFRDFGPDARELLEVIAFYPQGVDERNLDRLFPTTPNIAEMFDNFCILSLTYRSGGFVTMFQPHREYLSPKDPLSSPLLCLTKDCYFRRLSAVSDAKDEEGRWIISEDANVEHLLDVFTSTDANSDNVWGACIKFISYLYWHKPRSVGFGQRIKGLPDDHPSKPDCLFWLSNLAQSVGDHPERDRLLTKALELWKTMGDLPGAAMKLRLQFNANLEMGRHEEAIRQAKEALGIFEQLDDIVGRSRSMTDLAQVLAFADQLDAAEEFASRAITLLPKDSDKLFFCHGHRILGGIYRSKGNDTKAIGHFEEALRIASSQDWHNDIPPLAMALAILLSQEGKFDEASAHVERAGPHAVQADSALNSAQLMGVQAIIWAKQDRFEEAVSEISRAVDAFEKLGASKDAEIWQSALDGLRAKMQPLVADPAQMLGESNDIIDKYTIPAWASASGSPKHVVFLQGHNGRPYGKVVEDRGGLGVEQQE